VKNFLRGGFIRKIVGKEVLNLLTPGRAHHWPGGLKVGKAKGF